MSSPRELFPRDGSVQRFHGDFHRVTTPANPNTRNPHRYTKTTALNAVTPSINSRPFGMQPCRRAGARPGALVRKRRLMSSSPRTPTVAAGWHTSLWGPTSTIAERTSLEQYGIWPPSADCHSPIIVIECNASRSTKRKRWPY
jgi:hypothetical protein